MRSAAGSRAHFHGPRRTGKTLATGSLSKFLGEGGYCFDLTSVVSEYIGEIEKNRAALVVAASERDRMSFLGEADAVFGWRAGANEPRDRYANRDVSYLLQRGQGRERCTSSSRPTLARA